MATDIAAESDPASKAAAIKAFTARFRPVVSDICKLRKVHVRKAPVGLRRSTKKQGTRKSDVQPKTLKERVTQFPNDHLSIRAGQLFCEACNRDIGSSKTAVVHHVESEVHKKNSDTMANTAEDAVRIKNHIDDYEARVEEEHGAPVQGSTVSESAKVFRAQVLQMLTDAGIEIHKLSKLRKYLEEWRGESLTAPDKLQNQYLPPLRAKELQQIKDEIGGQLYGVYHDETSREGEAFTVIIRIVTEQLDVLLRCIRVDMLNKSMTNTDISAALIEAIATVMQMPLQVIMIVIDN